jgi:methionine synthase II (cobalamin-independent)
MQSQFQANCHPMLVGSLPLEDHSKAADLVFEHTPAIPSWVQLPVRRQELMVPQFMPGLPGLKSEESKMFVDTAASDYDNQLLVFYEEYMAVMEGTVNLDQTRFVLDDTVAGGFSTLLERLYKSPRTPVAVKGQVTGPVTFCTGVHDENKNAIFYNDQLRDAAVKLLALKAAWQARRLSTFGCPVIISCDEPALAGYGTSEFISISRDDIMACLDEVIEAIHSEGGLAGVHVCANTDWSLVLESAVDIVNFDAYSYFDRFSLYPDQIKKFLESGKILAWGIVPTGNTEDIEKETGESLLGQWIEKSRVIEELGIARPNIFAQSLITPSCGAGPLPLELANKVLRLTAEISNQLRSEVIKDNE